MTTVNENGTFVDDDDTCLHWSLKPGNFVLTWHDLAIPISQEDLSSGASSRSLSLVASPPKACIRGISMCLSPPYPSKA